MNAASFEAGSRFTRDAVAFPIEAAINVAGLRSVMSAYGDVDGIPAGVNRELLNDLLRDEMGFEGFVIADYMALQHALERSLVASDIAEVARIGLHAGLDLEAPYLWAYGEVLAAEVEAGRVPMEELDTSVLRILTPKFELGLFERPYAPEGPIEISPMTAEGADLAIELAERSVVLLENDGVLPLQARAEGRGRRAARQPGREQFAASSHPIGREMFRSMESGGLGNLEGTEAFKADREPADTIDLETEDYVRLRYAVGSLGEEVADLADGDVVIEPGVGVLGHLDGDAMARAVAAARDADVVVLALGGFSAAIGGGSEGEGTDTADIALPAAQRELADAVAATGTPVVVVLIQGRAYTLPPSVLESQALVVGTFAGQGARHPWLYAERRGQPERQAALHDPPARRPVPDLHYQRADSGYR